MNTTKWFINEFSGGAEAAANEMIGLSVVRRSQETTQVEAGIRETCRRGPRDRRVEKPPKIDTHRELPLFVTPSDSYLSRVT